MKDYTSYMLAEMLTGTFKAYGSAYGHGVSGVTMGAKTGTSTYGTEINQQYNLPDNAAKDVWINGFTPKYTMSIWMGFSEIKEGGVNSFLGHSEQEYPQYLYEDVMSDITSSDDGDFKKPDSVNGSSADNLSVSGHPDNNTTNREVAVAQVHQIAQIIQITQVILILVTLIIVAILIQELQTIIQQHKVLILSEVHFQTSLI